MRYFFYSFAMITGDNAFFAFQTGQPFPSNEQLKELAARDKECTGDQITVLYLHEFANEQEMVYYKGNANGFAPF